MNIIVTGASQGIGRELVFQLAEHGHHILGIARNTGKLQEVAQIVSDSARHTHFDFLDLDIANPTAPAQISSWVTKHWNTVDVLINNAGYLIKKPATQTLQGDLQQVFETNLFAPFLIANALHTQLKARGGAHVVNIGSMGGVQGTAKFPGLAAYSSAKGALAILTECLAEEWKEDNISCNCLALGAAQTEMLAAAFPGYQAPISGSQMAVFIADFAQNGKNFFNGKILPVSVSTP